MFADKANSQGMPRLSVAVFDGGADGATLKWDSRPIDVQHGNHFQRFSHQFQQVEKRTRCWAMFFILWLVIGLVSAYDAFLAMKYREELPPLERNFIGQVLLELDGDEPALFLASKFLGTMGVLGILANLYHFRPSWAMTIAYCVTFYQMGLLVYLTWG